MNQTNTQVLPFSLARAGGWLIAFAGATSVIMMTYLMTGTDVTKNPKGYADAATSVIGLGVGYLYLIGLIGLFGGLFALYLTLASASNSRMALGGVIFGGLGVGLLLAVFGAITLGGAVAANVYLGSDAGASQVMKRLSGGSFDHELMNAIIVALVLSIAGAILFGISIWRANSLPRWSSILFAIGLVLLVLTFPVVTQIGGVLLVIAGVQIARFDAVTLAPS
ncbi:MAG TPA: hypothetical protein VHV31_02760, partial [Nitrolancea sp.]|nr:hypothetical protein [Nitrolancea sp.]